MTMQKKSSKAVAGSAQVVSTMVSQEEIDRLPQIFVQGMMKTYSTITPRRYSSEFRSLIARMAITGKLNSKVRESLDRRLISKWKRKFEKKYNENVEKARDYPNPYFKQIFVSAVKLKNDGRSSHKVDEVWPEMVEYIFQHTLI